MSKGSIIMGTLGGKLGDMVTYRAKGEQRQRAYVKNVKNPKTIAQMTQRLLTLNSLSLFKGIKGIASQSFVNRKSNQSSFNAFMSANSAAKKFFITKEMLEQNLCVPYGAILSKGNIGLPLQPVFEKATYLDVEEFFVTFSCLFDAQKITNYGLFTGSGAQSLSGSSLVSALRQSSIVALPNEFTLTFVAGVQQEFELASGDVVMPWKMAYKVMHVVGDTYTESIFGCPESILTGSLFFVPSSASAPISADNPALFVGLRTMAQTAEEAIVMPCGLVLSYVEDGELKISDSTMYSNFKNIGIEAVSGVVSRFMSGSWVYTEAMTQYGYNGGSLLNQQSLATQSVEVSFTGSFGDLLVNGSPAGTLTCKAGDTLVFSTDSTEGIGISYEGSVIALNVVKDSPASWVVPAVDTAVLSCEQEIP